MSTRAEAKATVEDISNDGDLNTAQTQISRKGKKQGLDGGKTGVSVTLTSLLVIYSIVSLPPTA